MDPVTALRQIAYYKDRAREDPRRVMAYRNAADVVEALTEAQRDKHGAANSWQSLPRIGPETAKVIAQAWAGQEPDVLVELRESAQDLGGGEIRAALRGEVAGNQAAEVLGAAGDQRDLALDGMVCHARLLHGLTGHPA